MLFTRCPGCQTTFRISADTLRVAHGAVRCGNCTTVFSAYTGLRQDSLPDDPDEGEDFLSPTLQTQELAAIEELASPEIDALVGGGADPGEPDELSPSEVIELAGADEPDEPPPSEVIELADEDDVRAPEPPAPDADESEPVELDAAVEPVGAAEPEVLEFHVWDHAPVEPAEPETRSPALWPAAVQPGSGSSSAKLHFEAPVDEWALLLREIERSVDEGASRAETAAENRAGPEASSPPLIVPLPETDESPELWDIGQPFSLDAYDDTAERRKLDKLGPRASAAAKTRTPPERDEIEDLGRDELADIDEAISAEQIDATLSAEPDPEIIAALEAGLGPAQNDASRGRRWMLGSLALTVALGAQVLHHYRAELAAQPGIGAVIGVAYGLLGVELVPEWDLEQYEITNWAATAALGDGGPGNLHITAQIRNRGPRAQPYPRLSLELKDRWEAIIGSRVFAPDEYLMQGSDSTMLMAAGAIVPADLVVVDPGLDASGFELDVCLEVGAGRVTCSRDRVFQ